MPCEDSERLARIEEKLDALLEQKKDHESRLRSLERSRYWLMGLASGMGLLFDQIKDALFKR